MTEIEILHIPSERVKAIIGKKGSTKERIEEKCNVELVVDSEGEVQIKGESSEVFFALDVVKAIGRGFSADDALKLMQDDYCLYIIPLKEIAATDKEMIRLKGRVIGEKGSIKSQIENATDSNICVYGSTIGIIARIDSIEYTKEAINKLLQGANHSSVLSYLARIKRELMHERLRG